MQHLWNESFSHQLNDVESRLDSWLRDDDLVDENKAYDTYLNWMAKSSRWHDDTLDIVEDFFAQKQDQLFTLSRVSKKFLK
jgi:hypothetical protein